MLKTFIVYVCLAVSLLLGFSYYRTSLIQQGYDKAVSDFRNSQDTLTAQHQEKLVKLSSKISELSNENQQKTAEIAAYRAKFNLATNQLRKQQADFSARIETSSRESLSRYAEAADSNFERCRSHVERLGLEAASSAGVAETLKSALDLANEKAPEREP
jgi:predicted negative regulator of RcsB-dependent stress response